MAKESCREKSGNCELYRGNKAHAIYIFKVHAISFSIQVVHILMKFNYTVWGSLVKFLNLAAKPKGNTIMRRKQNKTKHQKKSGNCRLK